jgi:N4-gp56 family major capsid protein
MSTGLTTIGNNSPEVPLQASEFFLSTPQFNLIHSFGAQKHYAKAFLGRVHRLSRYAPLDLDGGQLDGSGIDPAPEVPVRTDIDADMEIFAKSIIVNEQVDLWSNRGTMAKYMALLGQWMRNKEDILMRDLFASSVSYTDAVGGNNGDVPTNPSYEDFLNKEAVLNTNDAMTVLESLMATDQFATSPRMDSYLGLLHTDLTPAINLTENFTLKSSYPGRGESVKKEEYGMIGRFRLFISSKAQKIPNASDQGQPVYPISLYGVEAIGKIEQTRYTHKLGTRPDWVVSSVAQNSGLYAKFAIGRTVQNQNWVTGLNVTAQV